MSASDIDLEVGRIITTARRFAHRMGGVFVVDPGKLRDFRIALENGRRRRALARESPDAERH
jgi:hypothetical protein